MKAGWIVVTLILALPQDVQTEDHSPISRVFIPGEELCYKVRWNFVRLGEITIRTTQDSSCTSAYDFRLSMIVKSNPDLPFIWIQEYNESLFDALTMKSNWFRARHRNGEDYYAVTQIHDSLQQMMTYTRTDLNTARLVRSDTLHNVSKYVEGPSLFFTARCLSRCVGKQNVPTLIEGKMHSTAIRTDGTIEEISIAAIDYPVRTRLLTGHAHWTGGSAAGISGEFTGWMSDDEAAVPIKAEMKIILGSITLELEKWTRPGWRAPFSQNAERRE